MSEKEKEKLKSQTIHSYFPVELSLIRAGQPLPFNIHLYFSKNDHVLVFRKKGEKLSADFLNQCRSKGIRRVWIQKDHYKVFREYLVTLKSEPGSQISAPLKKENQTAEQTNTGENISEPPNSTTEIKQKQE